MKHSIKFGAIAIALGSTLLLQGCNDNDNNAASDRSFNVEVTNLSNHQPFAPVAAVLHKSGYDGFSLGAMASDGLELLAEAGDPSGFVAEASADNMVLNTVSGTGVISPGGNETIKVQGNSPMPRLSLAGMLVNTNDGFIGLDDVDISALAMGESLILHARVYDAGTEANTEAATDVPGQGGEGMNAARDDRDFIAVHPGVVSMDDGLATSALDASHRFDNPAARIVITRTQP